MLNVSSEVRGSKDLPFILLLIQLLILMFENEAVEWKGFVTTDLNAGERWHEVAEGSPPPRVQAQGPWVKNEYQ